MIKVAHPHIETPMFLSSENPLVVTIENPKEYYNCVCSLAEAFNGGESDFTFWEENKQVKAAEKGDFVIDNFSFSVCDKKIINLLYKKLQNNFFRSDFMLNLNKLNSIAENFLFDISDTVDFPLVYDELTLESIFKAVQIKPAENYDSLLEKTVSYINVLVELKNIDFMVFVGLKGVLSNEELQKLYYHCELKKVALLIIECYKSRPMLKNEKGIIITEDLCEIVENFNT